MTENRFPEREPPSSWRSRAAGFAAAALGVGAVTALIHVAPGAERIPNVSMLYLFVVIGTALRFGSGSAILTSVLAFLAFDWFFIRPFRTLTVHDPSEWLALLMFLFTAATVGHLTATAQAQAAEARRRERETRALAEAGWAVASQVDRERALAEVLRQLAEVLPVRLAAIVLPDSEENFRWVVCYPNADGAPTTAVERQAFRFALAERRPLNWGGDSRHWEKALAGFSPAASCLPLTAENRVLGLLYLVRAAEREPTWQERRLVESLAGQASIVLERDRLTRAETQARALEEADRLKTALLSMISHDFRSPLTAIKASVTGLLQRVRSWNPETGREMLQAIDVETDRLDRMVGNILALSRLEADAWRPQLEATPPTEWVGLALGGLGAEANRRIDLEVGPDLSEVEIDPVQMAQVLRNLIDNALKYSPEATRVEVRARAEGDRLVLEVCDRGMGLPPGAEERIFEPFYRAPHLEESAVPGVGIGLTICRGLVEAHHGELTAFNREGGGAVFRLSLPLAEQP